MDELTITTVNRAFERAPLSNYERVLLQRIADPQNLNDALLAVRVDECIKHVVDAIAARHVVLLLRSYGIIPSPDEFAQALYIDPSSDPYLPR